MVSRLNKTYLINGIIICLILIFHSSILFAAGVVLSWTPPNTNADGTPLDDLSGYNLYYGMTSGNYSEKIDVGDALTYQVNNLSTGVTYYFATTAYDTSGNESEYSSEISKTFALPDTTQPVISGVGAINLTSGSVTIEWTTDEASDTRIEYGISESYGNTTGVNAAMVISHSQDISGLTALTLYHYRVVSLDASGNEAVSGDYSFTTLAPPAQVDYYCDNDNDGYINISRDASCTGSGCVPAGCQTAQGDDCNDGDASINPGIIDNTCDGIDNDCDGTPDNYYVTAAVSCGTGVCTSTGRIICQSGEEVNTCQPGIPAESAETTCGDGLDNDCDGLVDEGCSPDIKVSNVLLSEDFSSGLPVSWSAQGGWSADNTCGKTVGYPFAGKYAMVDSSCTTTDIDEAVTESIDTVSCSSVALTFSNQYYWYSGTVAVDVSNDGGSTWTNNVTIQADDGYPEPNWKELDISSVADVTDAQIKFRYANNAAAGFWALDNVWVTCQSDRLNFTSDMHVPSSKTLMISNTGTDTLTMDTINIAGPDASEFTVSAGDDCINQILSPAETCTVDVVFTPKSAGLKNATVVISSNDPDTPTMNVPLKGAADNILKPVPAIKVNNAYGVVNVARGEDVAATIELDPGSFNGNNADWWVLMEYRNRWYYYDASTDKWRRGYSFYKQGQLEKMGPIDLMKNTRWSSGQYTLYFGVDTLMNGIEDAGEYYYDSVIIEIQ